MTVSSPRRADIRNPWLSNADAIAVCPASGFISQNVLFGKKEQISTYAHCLGCLFNWEARMQIGGLSEEKKGRKESRLLQAFFKQDKLLAEAFRRSCTLASIVDLKSVQNSFEH